MKNRIELSLTVFAIFFCTGLFAQTPYTTDKELQMTAATLNLRITQNKDIPVILNVGTEGKIKGSLQVGVMTEKKDTDLLLKLKGVSKKQEVVVYCGCCTLDNCENIEKAFNILKKNGYTNVKALNLGEGYGPGWQGKGYPVEK
jgi:thiosulfate/3-mercaptopyruvate sulfurtransferase